MRFIKIMNSIVDDMINSIRYFIKTNIRNFASLLNVILPFAMYAIGQVVFKERGKFAIGGEIFIPIIVFVLTYFIRAYTNKVGKGTTIPVPEKRFTEVDDDGEVSIENNRLQELILYVADLEDWLKRKGLL